jgi:hypothetical protein
MVRTGELQCQEKSSITIVIAKLETNKIEELPSRSLRMTDWECLLAWSRQNLMKGGGKHANIKAFVGRPRSSR